MKRIFIILTVLAIFLGMTACGIEIKVNEHEENPDKPIGLPENAVEYSSLEEINNKIGVRLIRPAGKDIKNERFSVINDSVAQYVCNINGIEWTFRAAHITDNDISGIYSEYLSFMPEQDYGFYSNEYYYVRFFDGDIQYTVAAKDPLTEDGNILLSDEEFSSCCSDLESIQKYHTDDPLVGEYCDNANPTVTAYIERSADKYTISVNLGNYQDEYNEYFCWTMFNAVKDGDKLVYGGEAIGHYVYDVEGNETLNEESTAENEGWFEFRDGKLYWTGAAQEECRTYVFEKTVYDE